VPVLRPNKAARRRVKKAGNWTSEPLSNNNLFKITLSEVLVFQRGTRGKTETAEFRAFRFSASSALKKQ